MLLLKFQQLPLFGYLNYVTSTKLKNVNDKMTDTENKFGCLVKITLDMVTTSTINFLMKGSNLVLFMKQNV